MQLSNAILTAAIAASASLPAVAAQPARIRVIVAFEARMADQAKAAIAAARGEDTRFISGMHAADHTRPAADGVREFHGSAGSGGPASGPDPHTASSSRRVGMLRSMAQASSGETQRHSSASSLSVTPVPVARAV